MSKTIANEIDINRSQDGYEELLECIRRSFGEAVKNDGSEPLFRTDASGLYDLFLSNLPGDVRQHYNCNACRSFVNHYGGLVRIDENGYTHPVMWTYAPPGIFILPLDEIRETVKNAKVIGVFLPDKKELGLAENDGWHHMAVEAHKNMIRKNLLKNGYQLEAEKAEEYRMLTTAIDKYQVNTIATAVNLLQSEALYRGEKTLGVAEWFLNLKLSAGHHKRRRNMIWKAVATAPTGFCHISSGMIGTLLDDIEAGLSLESVKRKFAEKMDPLKYQRPQAAPTMGNVKQAEKIVDKLGIADSLKRRFARLEEIQTIWKPRPAKSGGTVSGGVFAGIQTKGTPQKTTNDALAPMVTMTWEKFQRTVLPSAKKIEYMVTGNAALYSALVTAEDPEAPPIIQWDSEENRNPFNWYVYKGGSYPMQWNLGAGYCEVTGIALQPNMWQPGFDHQGKSAFFILNGCKDTLNSSSALFPEVLKSELHEVRATIEAYSREHKLSGYGEASACGVRLQANLHSWNHTFRVTTDLGVTIYKLDRWD